MTTLDATAAECRVFTFKEGALSAIAHDLELAVGRCTIEVSDALAIDARFALDSLRVLHAVKDGRPTTALGDGDKRKIERTLADEVLAVRRHPEARFVGRAEPVGDAFLVTGELTLHGRTRAISTTTRVVGGRQQLELTLHQPDFGITPYRAMLGALKVKADVRVTIAARWPR